GRSVVRPGAGPESSPSPSRPADRASMAPAGGPINPAPVTGIPRFSRHLSPGAGPMSNRTIQGGILAARRRSRASRPRVEHLEGRRLLASFAVNSTADAVDANPG